MTNPAPTYLEGSVELAAQSGARTVALVWEDTAFPAAVAQGIRDAAWDPTIRTEGYITTNEMFVRRYEATYNRMPDYQAAAGFGAVELLAEGINRAATPTGEIDRASIRDFLFATSKLTVLGPFGVYPLGDTQAGAQPGASELHALSLSKINVI